jgi:hypothetical protein
MCTVTYIPSGDHFFFTSNRDEQAGRAIAAFPELHKINGQNILFPKDQQAGGSWIAVHENGNVAVMLNGAVRAHQPEPPYRKSRGLILLDLVSKSSPAGAFEDSDFTRIEPFTVILFEEEKLWSGKWDGMEIQLQSLNTAKPHIWSSVTLYDPFAIHKRETWFSRWLAENPNPSATDIIRFHQQGGDGDPFNDLLMNREGRLFTNSISSIRLSPDAADFRYIDLRNSKTADRFMPFQKTIPVKA